MSTLRLKDLIFAFCHIVVTTFYITNCEFYKIETQLEFRINDTVAIGNPARILDVL